MTALERWLHRVGLGLAVLVELCPLLALADSKRVVLLDPGVELTRAARVALEPWQVELVVVSAPTPGATAPATHERARDIARTQDAVAVVWTSASSGGYALWMFARAGEHVVARHLSIMPPFDAVSAAAVALSIKTLLRHSETAPVAERYGALLTDEQTRAVEQSTAPPPWAPNATRTLSASTTTSFNDVAAPRDVASQKPTAVHPATLSQTDDRRFLPSRGTPSDVQLELTASTRFLSTTSGGVEPRFGVGATWWPRQRRAGISLATTLGPAQELDSARFRGTLRDYGAGLLARLRHDLGHAVRLVAGLGMRVDLTQLDGNVPLSERSIARTFRLAPAAALDLGADAILSAWTRIGLRAGGAWLLRTQRYLVRGEPVVELSRRSYEATLVVVFSLPRRL